MPRLYVFIDESRIPENQDSPFFAGAVWCVPKPTTGVPKALRTTALNMKDRLQERLGHPVDEIHYSHGAAKYAHELLTVGFAEVERDDSVSARHDLFPFSGIGFTTAIIDKRCESCYRPRVNLSGRPDPDFGNHVRSRAVAALLQPVLSCDRGLELGVVLDSPVWKPGVESHFGRNLEKLLVDPNIKCQVEYEDSRKVCGLQIADLVAGILRDHVIACENEDALSLINKRIIHRIGARIVKGVQPLKIE